MFSKVYSSGIYGIEGYLVHVEADVSGGLPGMSMVGYLASEVREAQDRVRSALKNSGFSLPARKVTVNLSPADIRKEGTAFDLPIAIAVLSAFGMVSTAHFQTSIVVGELGLDGTVKPIKGALSLVSAARKEGFLHCFLPKDNVREGRMIDGVAIIGVESLKQIVDYYNNPIGIEDLDVRPELDRKREFCYGSDFSEVNGQLLLRRVAEIAAAGNHNLLLVGQAGVGKTMIAQRIPTIMPILTPEERLEILKVYSVAGVRLPGGMDSWQRPFRSPHHTVTPQALAGGGRIPKPGELSLASGGVLFLDEFPEFHNGTIEVLRQPLEEHKITVSRIHGTFDFPARILLVASMNPCPCGCYPDIRCTCSPRQVQNYLGKISKPFLDRIDICVEASSVSYAELHQKKENESSLRIRERVENARTIQRKRFVDFGILTNSEMGDRELRRFCRLSGKDENFLEQVFTSMSLSPRAFHKVLKVARTIADLEGTRDICHVHLCEAVAYRGLEQKYWNGGDVL